MLCYLITQCLSRDSIVCLGSLHQKIFPFSLHPQSICLQQSFTARYHTSSVIMEQHFHTYSSLSLILLWLPGTLTLISKCVVKNQLRHHAVIHVCNSQKEIWKLNIFSEWPQLMDSGLTTSHMWIWREGMPRGETVPVLFTVKILKSNLHQVHQEKHFLGKSHNAVYELMEFHLKICGSGLC